MEYRKIGSYIRQVDVRNAAGRTDNLLGLSVQKTFMPSIANTIGTDFTKYKVVKRGQFTYIPDTSRRGDKIAVALLRDCEQGLVSNVYTVFEVTDTNALDPEYLMLWFQRPEFDRYARFHSHGSVREIFDWDSMCEVEIPFPPIDAQRKLVYDYKVISDRIALKRRINENLLEQMKTVYKHLFPEDVPCNVVSLSTLCSKIGSGATPKGGKHSYFEDGISFIRSMNVFDYVFSYDDLAHISDSQANYLSGVTVLDGDVLFNITGVSVTRCCMVPHDVLPARVNQHVMILRPFAGKYMSYYLMYSLCDSVNKNALLGISCAGSTRDAINKQEMESYKISLPTEKKLREFGKTADAIHAQIYNNEREIHALMALQSNLTMRLSALKRLSRRLKEDVLQAIEDARNGINISGPFRTAEEAVASMLED